MQVYCEPYFAALDNWARSKEEGILFNRLQAVETLGELFLTMSQNPLDHHFEIVCENSNVDLLPEVVSTAGKVYVPDGDQIVFKAVMKKIPKDLFQRAGVVFQDHLLKGIAGYSEEKLQQSNDTTRSSLIACVEKLFRVPEEAGDVHIYCTKDVSGAADTMEHPLVQLSLKGTSFFQYLLQMARGGVADQPITGAEERPTGRGARSSGNASSGQGPKKKRTRDGTSEDEAEFEEDRDGVMWTKNHKSVGWQVAAHFPPLEVSPDMVPKHDQPSEATQLTSATGKIFRGRVVKYAKPSAPGMTDQLYHIKWEDSDEQDFDELDLERGMDLFDTLEGWTRRHHSVGTRVAAYFEVPVTSGPRRGTQEHRLFFGEVEKYATPTEPGDQPLYHIKFDDGDEQDFNDAELQLGVELCKNEVEADTQIKNGKKKSKTAAAVSNGDTAGVSAAAAGAKSSARGNTTKTARGAAVKASSAVKATLVQENEAEEVELRGSPPPQPLKESSSGRPLRPSKVLSEANEAATVSKPLKKPKEEKPVPKSTGKAKSAKGKTARPKKSGKGKDQAIELDNSDSDNDDDPVWTMHHDSVGKRVAQHFLVSAKGQKERYEVFGGTVAVYAPPSRPRKADQLYHVVWDDGDEADLDEGEFQAGLHLLDKLMPTDLCNVPPHSETVVRTRRKALAVDFDTDEPASNNGHREVPTTTASSAEDGTEVDLTNEGDEANEGAGEPAATAADATETPNDDFLSVRQADAVMEE
jgi:hypothetical protein